MLHLALGNSLKRRKYNNINVKQNINYILNYAIKLHIIRHMLVRLNKKKESMPDHLQVKLIKKFAEMSKSEQIDILKLKMDLRRQRTDEKSSPELEYECFVNAIAKHVKTNDVLSRKSYAGDSEKDRAKLLDMRIKAFKKSKNEGAVEKRYRNYHQLVKELRTKEMGFRACAEFLLKYHKFKISHNYLRKLFERYEGLGEKTSQTKNEKTS